MQKLKLNDAETQSADIVAENIAQLRTLFPDAFAEGKIDFEVLKQLLGGSVDERDEKYGLNWHGKRLARQLALTTSTGTLRPYPTESLDWETTPNLFIEGDNLEVLKLLQKSYAGRVKLIYIDPPYNTGKDFVYPDDFRDNIKNYLALTGQIKAQGEKVSSNTETSGRFHTNWLNMMLPRLKLAKALLQRDGIILISIDDQEVANLRLLCDEVFGPENFVASLIWEKSRKNDAKLVSIGHDYVLIYAKSLGYLKEQGVKWREEKPGAREIWNHYLELRSELGDDDQAIETQLQAWFSDLPKTHPSKKWSRYRRVDKNGPWRDYDISWPGGGGPRYDVVHPVTGKPCEVPERGWVFSAPETMDRMIALGVVEFRDDHTEPPIRKLHLRPLDFELEQEDEDEEAAEDSSFESDDLATQVRGTYFYKQTQVTAKYMRSLMGGKVFDNPKDHVEIGRLINYVTCGDPKAIVLDFFAGSGTTAQSVWELNQADGGGRRFILVQLPEPLDPTKKDQKAAALFCQNMKRPLNLAELTKERLRRARREIEAKQQDISGDLGFRVFKLDSSNIEAWDPNRADIAGTLDEAAQHLKTDRTEQDILYELLLKLGLDLAVPMEEREIAGKSVNSIGAGVLIACLVPKISGGDVEALGQGIVQWQKTLSPAGETTVVFRDSAFPDDVAKTNLTAILQQHGLLNVRSL